MSQIDADAEAELALPLAADDEQRVEHSPFVPAMKRQAAGQDRRARFLVRELDIVRRLELFLAAGLARFIHRSKELGQLIRPGEAAAVIRVPRVGPRLFDWIELD